MSQLRLTMPGHRCQHAASLPDVEVVRITTEDVHDGTRRCRYMYTDPQDGVMAVARQPALPILLEWVDS